MERQNTIRSWLGAAVAGAIAALIVSLFVAPLFSGRAGAVSNTDESSYARVVKSGKIRAAFVSYPPASIVDPSGGAVTGVFPDLLREIGKVTSLEVEFTEEVGYADMIQGLENGRYDIIGGVWANPNRGKMATISTPVYYTGVGIWVRPNENRFEPSDRWASINKPEIRIAAIDGSTPLNIARDQFPAARVISYPNLTAESQLFLDLVQGRVDIFFAEPAQGMRFLESNPGSIKNIASETPLRAFASVYLMRANEPQLKTLVDTAISELRSSGKLEDVIARYEPAPKVFLRPAIPYERDSK